MEIRSIRRMRCWVILLKEEMKSYKMSCFFLVHSKGIDTDVEIWKKHSQFLIANVIHEAFLLLDFRLGYA